MDWDEAIEWLKGIKKYAYKDFPGKPRNNHETDMIISLLKRGKAYKEMWGELKKLVKNLRFNNEYLLQEMKNLEISGGRK
jgi:hypothetical protein